MRWCCNVRALALTYVGVAALLANEIVSETILQIQTHFERLMNQEWGRKITGESLRVGGGTKYESSNPR